MIYWFIMLVTYGILSRKKDASVGATLILSLVWPATVAFYLFVKLVNKIDGVK